MRDGGAPRDWQGVATAGSVTTPVQCGKGGVIGTQQKIWLWEGGAVIVTLVKDTSPVRTIVLPGREIGNKYLDFSSCSLISSWCFPWAGPVWYPEGLDPADVVLRDWPSDS